MALISCEECGSEVSSKAKTCPKCGVRILAEPIGCGMTIGVVVVSVIIIPVILSVSLSGTGDGASSLGENSPPTLNRDRGLTLPPVERVNLSPLKQLKDSKPSGLSPDGDLAEMFSYGSDFTDLQRELKLKEIHGQVVEWYLPVYEVRKSGDTYTVQTDRHYRDDRHKRRVIGTLLRVSPTSEGDVAYIESLKTGDVVRAKGVIGGSTMRSLEIAPAILIYKLNNSEASTLKPIVGMSDSVANSRASAAGKVLESQLACTTNPNPATVIRAMMANGLLRITDNGYDGIAVLEPTTDIYVFGKKVKYVEGWDAIDAGGLFYRPLGAGMLPSISVLIDAKPHDVVYTEHANKDVDGVSQRPYSTISTTDIFYEKSGATITCHGSVQDDD